MVHSKVAGALPGGLTCVAMTSTGSFHWIVDTEGGRCISCLKGIDLVSHFLD